MDPSEGAFSPETPTETSSPPPPPAALLSAPPAPPPSTPVTQPAAVLEPGPKKVWRYVAGAVAVTGTLAAAAALVVPLLVDRGEKETAPETLTVRHSGSAPEEGSDGDYGAPLGTLESEYRDGYWMVPLSAPIETFPAEPYFLGTGQLLCSEEQSEWLKTYGTRLEIYPWETQTGEVSLRLANEATSGGALSLNNVRFEVEEEYQEGWVRFECPLGDRGGGTLGQSLLLSAQGGPAIFGEPDPDWYWPEELEPEGTPVTLNLDPGEAMHYHFELPMGSALNTSYVGRILADLADGSGTTVALADPVVFGPTGPPQFTMGYVQGARPTLLCGETDSAVRSDDYEHFDGPCTPQEAAARARAALLEIRGR